MTNSATTFDVAAILPLKTAVTTSEAVLLAVEETAATLNDLVTVKPEKLLADADVAPSKNLVVTSDAILLVTEIANEPANSDKTEIVAADAEVTETEL